MCTLGVSLHIYLKDVWSGISLHIIIIIIYLKDMYTGYFATHLSERYAS